jgi:hypothetical protein
MSMTVNPVNDIYKQAHQGSVAAIIQVLNDKLADSGVRTRAIFANGVLQLLCEAPTYEQLEQTMLVDRVQKILEEIEPKNIRRVNINSRIVREQQLLWLDEINRDPDGQLLWSKEIGLKYKNPLKRLLADWRESRSLTFDQPRAISPQIVREKRQFTKGILGGLGLSAVLLTTGWAVYSWRNGQSIANSQTEKPSTVAAASQNTIAQPNPAASAQPENPNSDPFATAVRLAEKASDIGKTAQTSDQWRELAEMWGKASNLMGAVPATDKRYAIAQDRTALYRRYQESALEKVK